MIESTLATLEYWKRTHTHLQLVVWGQIMINHVIKTQNEIALVIDAKE
jgi:hypothetical protein